MTPVGRQSGYQDPPALRLEGHVDLTDELERSAVALHRFTFATPEEVASLFSSEYGREELAETWAKTDPSERRLYRLRADVLVTVHSGADR
jgi:hypothetical protein